MAGGKETPRQKMIGMMYLVLTALLALNVSKSILDAFVAIEENIQKSNIAHLDRGNGFYSDIKSEINTTPNKPENKSKLDKLNAIIKQMDAVDKITAKMIEDIDKIKMEILEKSGENIKDVKDNDELTLVWKKGKGVTPTRMNLMAVQAKDQYDVPMHEIIGEDIKTPTGSGKKLWADFNNYRAELIKTVGSYNDAGKSFSINPKAINEFKTNAELSKLVEKMIAGSKANVKDDGQVLKDIYINLTKPERMKVHDMEGVHWIGATFDHSPLVAAVASLSSMQQDILSARAMAMAHLKSKVSTGEYSFNKIVGLAYGPSFANNGDEVELKVMMAAFDSDNQPTVTGPGSVVVENGQGTLKTKASGSGEMKISGTVSIKNKSGVTKTEPWSHTVKIMKPEGTVSLPELQVLYRSYDNKVVGLASGYPETKLIPTQNVTLTKSGTMFIAKPGSGKEAKISISGYNPLTKKTANLGTFTFSVRNLPKAQVFWGTNVNGAKVAVKTVAKLKAGYDESIPLKVNFSVIDWFVSVSGVTKEVSGKGDMLNDEALRLIRLAKPGSKVTIQCTYSGPGVRSKSVFVGDL